MKILILGAGQVGSSAAYHLSREEANEVTVVDTRADVLRELQDRLDIRTVVGHGAYPEVLERAGADDVDIIVALTDADETNMIACQVAYTLYHLGQRVRHGKFGDGVILNCEGQGAHARVEVNFETAGTKWLVLNYANLDLM